MKKILSIVLTAVLALAGIVVLSLTAVSPASANVGNIGYCQATNSDRNPFNYITASIDSLLDEDGNFKQGGINANDIVPAFSYINKESVRKYFDGQNTTKTTLTAADCPGGPEQVIAEPNDPTYVPPSCAAASFPFGKVVVPSDLGKGVGSASDPVLNEANKTFSLAYTLAADTKKEFYQWADVAGDTKTYILNAKHISEVNDPLYIVDEKTGVGACELSNTGGGITETAVLVAGGALGLGMIFLGFVSLMNRRRTS